MFECLFVCVCVCVQMRAIQCVGVMTQEPCPIPLLKRGWATEEWNVSIYEWRGRGKLYLVLGCLIIVQCGVLTMVDTVLYMV